MSEQTRSFSLIRTNPKITGNIKITVDSAQHIWLNSIDANKQLSSNNFKKFRLNLSSTYESDLMNFIGTLSPDIVFASKENNPNPDSTSRFLKDQFDFFYASGAQPLISNLYDEDYSYFAPVWMREEFPDYFVIFRLDEPLDYPYNDNVQSGSIVGNSSYLVRGTGFAVLYASNTYFDGDSFTGNGNTTYNVLSGTGKIIDLNENKDLPIDRVAQFDSILKRARIIKTFDLTANSEIGQYIRRLRNNKLLPDAAMTVRFGDGLMTTWNGVSYQDGSMTSKGERLDKFWNVPQLQIDFEEYITNGFQRHGIICPFLLNLEFLFSDDTTPMYSIPRYFGFYVNKIETGFVQLDGQSLFNNRATSGNTPSPKRSNKGYRQDGEDFYQNNTNGVRLFYTNEIQSGTTPLFIPNSNDFSVTNFEPRIYWVQDKDGLFHSLDQRGTIPYNTPLMKDLVIRDETLNLGRFAGAGVTKLQAKGSLLTENGRSYMTIKVNANMFPNDKIFLYWNLGSQLDVDGKYNVVQGNDLSKRPFSLLAGGTTLTFVGLDLTPSGPYPEFKLGQILQLFYNGGTSSVMRTITSTPIFALGNTTFSINIPIDLSTTSGFTPIVAGWGPGSALASDDDFTIYYHPYGTPVQIASALAKAFNLIKHRTFDAAPVGAEMVIRMRKGESVTNQFFCKITLTDYTTVNMQGISAAPATKFYLEGGTDRANTRLRFLLEDTDILKGGESFAKTKNGQSKIIFVGRYVDEVTLGKGSSEISTFGNFDTYGVFVIEDNLDQTFVADGIFLIDELYKIPVGLFSFFNVKDIDGDFFSSTYSRSPNNEYHRYYDLLPDAPNIFVFGRNYLILGGTSDIISYLGASMTGGVEFPGCQPSQTETMGTGNGAVKTFSCTVQFPPISINSITITDGVEIFTDNGFGRLIGNLGGIGTIDYTSGFANLTFSTAPANLALISFTYQSDAGFTVVSGNPIVVQKIFYNRSIPHTENIVIGLNYFVRGIVGDTILYNAILYTVGASFTGVVGVSNYTITVSSAVGTPTVVQDDFLDQDLQAFKGFWKFKDFSSVDAERIDRSNVLFTNREKFIHNDLFSEYDYLKENFSKEEALKSRAVPTVAKWVYKDGKDIRDNDYRLNTHPGFGQFGLSPSFQVKTQDPASLTHEWYYLEQGPWQMPEIFKDDNYYYFNDNLILDPTNLYGITDANPTSTDYFVNYFTFQTSVNTSDQERFSTFLFNSEIKLSETLFRGVKLRVKEAINTAIHSQLVTNKPQFKDGSTRFVDYKFSCLLRVKKENILLVESPVILQVIENKTFKTMTFLVDVIIQDYRTLKIIDHNFLGSTASPAILYPDLLPVSVDYLNLYSIKSKETESTFIDSSDSFKIKGTESHGIGDIKLSVSLNLSNPSSVSLPYTRINVFDNPDYDWDLRDEIKNFNADNKFEGSFVYAPSFGSAEYPYPLSTTQTQILFGIPGFTYPQSPSPYPNFLAISMPVLIPSGAPGDWQGFPIVQLNGGNLYFEPIMQRISFASIAEKINANSQYIKYRTFTWDVITRTTVETKDEFYLEMQTPSVVSKTQSLIPQTDENKPDEFKNESVIGVVYTTVNSISDLYRYEGSYEPKFKNVLFFAGQKTDHILISPSIDLSYKQATFNPNVKGFGNIQNLGYLKISNNEVLTLTNNKKFKPVYPLLHEVPLDTKDYFVFQSSWDPGFYRKNTDKLNFVNQAGSRDMQELKNFFGTKLMKTPTSITLETFNVSPVQLATLDQADVTKEADEIVWSIDLNNGTINGLIDVSRRALRFFVADGANAEFVKNLLPEFGTGDPLMLDDDVIEYLKLNIMPEYEVKLIDMYVFRYKQNLNLPVVIGTLTDVQKLQNKYILERNFTAKKVSDFVFSFSFKIDPSFNISIAPSIIVGKI